MSVYLVKLFILEKFKLEVTQTDFLTSLMRVISLPRFNLSLTVKMYSPFQRQKALQMLNLPQELL
jgi:hypothetical protein